MRARRPLATGASRRPGAIGVCALWWLIGCSSLPDASPQAQASRAHRCAQRNGTDVGARRGTATCEAAALGGERNKSSAQAEGKASVARAVAGSLDLFDNGNSHGYLASDDNSALAVAMRGAGALARSGVNKHGADGTRGNTAVARADRPRAFADASAANGSDNAASASAEGCVGGPGRACAFSAAGNGDSNSATGISRGRQAKAQAGALDGDHNTAVAIGTDGGRAVSNAQRGDKNTALSAATGEGAFASAQGSGGGSFALSRADGAKAAANATAQKAGAARALAESGATASATAAGAGFSAIAFASGAGTSASASHDADTDTGSCSGPGIAFAMTGGSFQCVRGF